MSEQFDGDNFADTSSVDAMPCLLPGPEGGMAWHGLSVATWWNSESRRLAADGVHVVEQQRWQDRLCADAVCICQVATQNMYAEVQYYIIFPKMRYEYGPNDLYLSVMNPTPRIALFVGWFVRNKNDSFDAKIVNTRLAKIFIAIFAPEERLPS